ncbi:hypothetical protein [Bradyrhizobium sp. USDA 3458]|nr:hypothetical protein [Bradyrhizobium sp. USDA 3458]
MRNDGYIRLVLKSWPFIEESSKAAARMVVAAKYQAGMKPHMTR